MKLMPLNTQAIRSPALGISHIVYGRQTIGRKVSYLVDSRGMGNRRAVPETIVLRRWRMRGASFSGTRLSSTLWRALPSVLGPRISRWHALDTASIDDALAPNRSALRALHLSAPSASAIRALLDVCPPKTMRALVLRHAELGLEGRSGVPDLFLFRRDDRGRATMPRFVEVKKPGEPVSQDQKDEIALLNSYGLPARVLRLIERDLATRLSRSRLP